MSVLLFLIDPYCEQRCESRNRFPWLCPILYIFPTRMRFGSPRFLPSHLQHFCRNRAVSLRIREIKQSGQLSARPGPPGAIAVPTPAPNQTVYILDQGLVRFAKFAAGILAHLCYRRLVSLWSRHQAGCEGRAIGSMNRIRQIRGGGQQNLVQDTQASLSQLERQAELTRTAQSKVEAGLKQIENVKEQVDAKFEEIVKSAAWGERDGGCGTNLIPRCENPD